MSELGQPISTHRGSFWAGGWLWYVGALLLLSSVFWAFGFVKSLLTGEGSAIEQLGTGVCSVSVGLALLVVPVMRLLQSVQVFERGLVHKRLLGTKTIARDRVRGARQITHRSRSGSHEEVEIELEGGRVESIVGITGAEQIVSFVRAWTNAPAAAPPSPGGWSPPGGASPEGWSPPPSGGGWTPPS